MRTEAPVVVEGPPDGDVDAIVAAVHEALGAGGMIRVPNPHAPAVLSRFDEEINRPSAPPPMSLSSGRSSTTCARRDGAARRRAGGGPGPSQIQSLRRMMM